MLDRKIIITCEHADHIIPSAYHHLFKNAEHDLLSHRGFDPGSLDVAKYLSRNLEAPLFCQKVSRLLIEMNRSIHADDLFSKYTIGLNKRMKDELVAKYYHPYRNEVEDKISHFVNAGESVLHVSVHTFTPELNGVKRLVDIGLLCDERIKEELDFCDRWSANLAELLPEQLVMINLPYNGADDGFTTYLRTKFIGKDYLGIEIEVNQKLVDQADWPIIKKALASTLS